MKKVAFTAKVAVTVSVVELLSLSKILGLQFFIFLITTQEDKAGGCI